MSAWETIVTTVANEFSDLDDLEQATLVTMRLTLATLLGAVLGFERENQGKAAGLRTHMLVAMGAALFVLVPEQAGALDDALSRVIQGVVAGVGFLCAGTILKSDTQTGHIRGLTTAAGLWLTAAMGVAVGLGYEATAVLSTIIALIVLHLVPQLVSRDK